MLFAELYRSLKACFTRKQGKVSRYVSHFRCLILT